MKTTVTSTSRVDPYNLKLPEELQIKPKWVIELPGKHEARIYEDEQWQRRHIPQEDGRTLYAEERVKGYRVDVTKSNGVGKPRDITYATSVRDGFVETLLELKLYIEQIALSLTPKTSTVSQRNEYDED